MIPLREASQILRDEMSEDEKKQEKKKIILLSIQTTDNEVLVNILR